MKDNILLLTDSYKVSHWRQYPPGTTKVYSFLESRGGLFPEVTFFGLQYYLKRYLQGVVVTKRKIAEAKELYQEHFFGDKTLFNESGWLHLLERHKGKLPIRICAVPEGTSVPVSNVLMTIESTDDGAAWLTNYLETLLSEIWYPSTVCTQSREMKRLILESLRATGSPELVDFKLHDFGFRGSTSVESAGIGGAAHLVNFKGTDTVAALRVAREYYGERMAGFSIPAAEHSTITSWGRERESDAYENMLTAYSTGFVAVVSDSFDIYRACRDLWGKKLKDKVLARDGTLVVRPDSGHPPTVVVEVLNVLGAAFGDSLNPKGYKVLHPKVRVIQGDGIDYEMMGKILLAVEQAGWSADNIAFGSGGGLLQKVNRDTQKFAFKCSAVEISGVTHGVMKDPITDPGKRSKEGKLALVLEGGAYRTIQEEKLGGRKNYLVPVFENGKILREYSFGEIRENARLM